VVKISTGVSLFISWLELEVVDASPTAIVAGKVPERDRDPRARDAFSGDLNDVRAYDRIDYVEDR
jgi:hypothetical protein